MNIRIRPLQETDAYTSVNWRNMPELWTYTKFVANRVITTEDELTWIRKVMADKTGARFAILVEDVYVGNIYLTDINDASAEYHIFIGDKSYWGKGVAKRASKLIIKHAKRDLNLKYITLGVNTSNIGARHLYDKLGFREVGIEDDGFIRMQLDLTDWQEDV